MRSRATPITSVRRSNFDFVSRKESDDPRLHGLGNVDAGPKLKVFADYSVSLLTGSVALYQDIGGNGQGMQIDD